VGFSPQSARCGGLKPTLLCVLSLLIIGARARAGAPAMTDPSAQAQQLIDRGLAYLKSQQQSDGSWQKGNDPPAITALALKASAQDPKVSKDAIVSKGFDKLLSYQHEDGGIYKDMLANYNTAIAISAISAAKDPKYQAQLDQAVTFLKRLQWTDVADASAPERKAVDANDPRFGGWGYGRKERPDGSNLQLALDALHDSGLKQDDPAYKNAIKFITRLQNFSETNDQPWAGNDGGFVYTDADKGESFAGEYTGPDGKRMLRSYGSMTYAGLKSFIYAGVTKTDPRVRAAFDWISRNWTLDENPGMRLNDPATAANGVFYYYHTLARAMNAYDESIITDANGKLHDWRIELINKLASLQKPDGSWAGEKRWMEDNPVLVTSYSVLALQEALHDLAEHPPKQQ
jgi:squalene-hopene/tetraprenyl-beta-curcumene cyclase